MIYALAMGRLEFIRTISEPGGKSDDRGLRSFNNKE